jgi:integrase
MVSRLPATLDPRDVQPGLVERREKTMPWRKYPRKEGKYGPIYTVGRNVKVRRDYRKMWCVFVNMNGERKNRTVGPGRKDLEKAIRAAETIASELKSQNFSHPEQPTNPLKPLFEEASAEWLDDGSIRWDPRSLDRFESLLRLHILPHPKIKGKSIDEIPRKNVRRVLVDIGKTLSPSTVELAHSVLFGIFEQAVEDEIIDSNPAARLLKKLLPPKLKRNLKDPQPFDIKEREVFLSSAKKVCSWGECLILKILAHAGFRLGEVLAMRLCHLDLRKRNYHVSESYNRHRFGLPKRGKKRHVDLPEFLVDELSRYVTHLKKESFRNGQGGAVDLLFVDPAEKGVYPYSQRKVQGLLKRVCRRTKLTARTPHDLRHTYATILLMAHMSPAYVQKQLGHSSISVTVDIYGHWFPGEGRQGLEEALSGDVRKSHIFAYNQKRLQ